MNRKGAKSGVRTNRLSLPSPDSGGRQVVESSSFPIKGGDHIERPFQGRDIAVTGAAHPNKRGNVRPGSYVTSLQIQAEIDIEKRRKMKTLERDELKACIEYLNAHPKVAWAVRMNVGAMKLEDRFVKFGFRGCSDIIGMLKGGRFIAFECKRKGNKLTDDQNVFLSCVLVDGGLAGWGTIDDCILMMNLVR